MIVSMCRLACLFSFSIALLSSPLHALDKTAYGPQKILSSGIRKLQISGVRGKLRVIGRKAKFYSVQVKHSKGKRSEDWNLVIDRDGDALVFEVFNVAYGAKWRTLVREEHWPEFDVEVSGPSQPAIISWREGDLEINGWEAPVEASFLRGHFKANNVTGALTLQAVDARVDIVGQKGALELKGEKGRIELSRVDAPVNINWLTGDLNAIACAGRWVVALDQGSARIELKAGTLKAHGRSTKWQFHLRSPADVELISDSGPAQVHWEGGGVQLFLSTRSGKMKLPKDFAAQMRDGIQVVEKEIAPKPKGQVFVRTQSGDISWQ